MGKSKAELGADSNQHYFAMEAVRDAHQSRNVTKAIELAVRAWQHIDGMMQYERRYGDKQEFESIESIDYVLSYAPLVFDRESLDQLSALLKAFRRIEKNTSANITEGLNRARALMWDAYHLWNLLESEGSARLDAIHMTLNGELRHWQWIADKWEWIGLVDKVPEQASFRLSLPSRLTCSRRAKCPSCGAVGEAPMLRLLDEIVCPRCQTKSNFVFCDQIKAGT
jgi:hypothetical protein